MRGFNLTLVIGLSMSGILYGGLTVIAWIHGFEPIAALLILASVALCAIYFAPHAPKRHAFFAGFLTAFFAIWTQIVFFKTYIYNNPEYAAIEIPFGLDPISYTALFSPLGGVMGGIVALLVAVPISAFSKYFLTKKKKQNGAKHDV